MDDKRELVAGEDLGTLRGNVPLQIELLTDQFYGWEKRGRGWEVYPFLIELEPPFIPFRYHWVPIVNPGFDDGRRPTLVSRIVEGVERLVTRKPRVPSMYDLDALAFEEPDPEILEDDTSIVEFRLSVPPAHKISREAVEQFLLSPPLASHPLSFEVVGLADEITVQMVVRAPDARRISQQLKAYFPEIAISQIAEYLRPRWEEVDDAAGVIVDFGLSREFMLPLASFRGFEVDPLIGVTAALADLDPREVAVLQVLFQPVRHPWAVSIMRSVLDHEGKPFFLDAPELAAAARRKVEHPLFAAVVRIGIRSPDRARAWEIGRALGGSLRVFGSPGGNELIPLANDEYDDGDHEEDLLLRQSRRCGMILSTEELVALVHPPSASVRVEKLKREARKTKAAPAIVTGPGLVLGTNMHAGKSVGVALTAEQRSRHMYVIGASGTGKSTFLLNGILQDLKNGEGIAVLDPHGDLIDQILGHVPEERIGDVILLDPADADWPVGFNILSAHSELERTLLASDLIAVFQRLATSWGDQMTSVLGNAILAFLENPRGGTLNDLKRFLIEKRFREEILATVTDPDIGYYWQHEFPMLKGSSPASILTRLDTFLRPKLIRYMVAQKEDRLDFRAMMDDGKILLARLSQGAIGVDNAYLLGTLLVAKLQQIAMSRQDVAESERRPFYVYIDEFHNFVTPSMEQILSGTRKYGLALILAHQELRQLASRSPEVLSSVIANPYTRICFRIGDQDARTLAEGFAAFDAKDLQNLGIGQALARVERAEYDFNLDTPPLPSVDAETARKRRDAIVALSREKYARPRTEIEDVLRSSIPQVPVQVLRAARETAATASPEPSPPTVEPEAIARAKRREPVPVPSVTVPPSPGRGGPDHKYLQDIVHRWAEANGWRAIREEGILDGLGRVDVALRKGERSVACEIGVSSTPEHELENVQKCLAGGFEVVALVSTERQLLAKVRALADEALAKEQRTRVHFGLPADLFMLLEEVEAQGAATEGSIRGYKVKVKYKPVTDQEKVEKKRALNQVIAKAMKRFRK